MMKLFINFSVILVGLIVTSCINVVSSRDTDNNRDTTSRSEIDVAEQDTGQILPTGASLLMRAYPDFIKQYKDGELILSDGSSVMYDSGREKTYFDKLDNTEPVDIFAWEYKKTSKPNYCEDPGRSRCDRLFKLMYGASPEEVRKRMVTINWFGIKVEFSSVNGAADSLLAVYQEIKGNTHLLPYTKTAGTFYWRKIRGTKRQSAHSYGIAIDLAVSKSNYWKWDNPNKTEIDHIEYKNQIPMELVEIFEKHGFIWGGRWYHYDTMHFEFRPELLLATA